MSVSDNLIKQLGLFQRPEATSRDPREIIQMALGAGDIMLQGRQEQTRSNDIVGGSSSAPVAEGDVQRLVQSMATGQFGWGNEEWDALHDLISRESGWNPNAQNPSSSAAGLFQFLDSTRQNYGITRDSPLQDQIRAGLQYIADRYQTPSGALEHWQRRVPINGRDVGNWY